MVAYETRDGHLPKDVADIQITVSLDLYLTRACHIAISVLVHHVWMTRNHSRFEGAQFDPKMIFRKIHTMYIAL